MRFSEFRSYIREQQKAPTIAMPEAVPSSFAGRTLFKDWCSPPWDLEWLDAAMCPTCAGDLTVVPSRYSGNIVLYDCQSHSNHRFVRMFHEPGKRTNSQ